jgi:SulP family sulfate permease
VLLTCFTLTVVFDMVVAVTAGIMLAALLFMRRMAEVTEARLFETDHPALTVPLPKNVLVYDISGPLFFGAAQKAMATLSSIGTGSEVVILRMEQVPVMDATGLVALESALDDLAAAGLLAIITGLQVQPRLVLAKAGLTEVADRRLIRDDIASAVLEAQSYLDRRHPSAPSQAPDAPAAA